MFSPSVLSVVKKSPGRIGAGYPGFLHHILESQCEGMGLIARTR
jgi:hypothetical protein